MGEKSNEMDEFTRSHSSHSLLYGMTKNKSMRQALRFDHVLATIIGKMDIAINKTNSCLPS